MKVGEQLCELLPHSRSRPRVPGWYKGGVGERFATTEIESRIGRLRLAASDEGLVRISLPGGAGSFGGWLRRSLPDAEEVPGLPVLEQARRELDEYFEGRRREFSLALDPRGTPFQLAVWSELRTIPFGETRSYGDVARALGKPGAQRAVGLANGANPLPLVIPCHRVIESSGRLGGYGGGLETKRRLLASEQGAASRGRLL